MKYSQEGKFMYLSAKTLAANLATRKFFKLKYIYPKIVNTKMVNFQAH